MINLLATGPQTAGAMAEALDLTPPALSRHLKVLRQHGVVRAQADPADNRIRIYQLQPQRLQDLAQWLAELEQQWQQQLQAFAAHVDSVIQATDS